VGFQSKTYSLSDEAVTWIEELRADYGSVNKGLLAIMAVNENVERGVSRATRDRQGRESISTPVGTGFDPTSIPGVSVGLSAPKVEGQFPCRCVHSGCKGSKFMGVSRFQNLCDSCREAGHLGDARNCERCYEDGNPA
jgi:hypothetical protein